MHFLLCMVLITGYLCGVAPLSFGVEKKRIVVVLSSRIVPYQNALKGFYESLNERGLEYEADEIVLNDRGGLDEKVLSKIEESNPHLIHTIGTNATRLIKNTFKNRPVVFSMVLNPVTSGLVKEMMFPGANITGASMDVPLNIQFSRIKKMMPKVKRVGVIYSESETGILVRKAERAAKDVGIKLVKKAVASAGDVPGMLKDLIHEVDFIWSVADSNVFTRETIREFLIVTLREKVPFMGISPAFVKAGALAAFQLEAAHIGRQAASIADNILRGALPSGTPVSVPGKVKLVLNSNTIKVLGIIMPGTIYDGAKIISP